MPARRRIGLDEGRAAVDAWLRDPAVDRATLATAVRFTLEELAARHPGRSVEVRVPPFGAVQCIEGSVHRRGTPPAVIEMAAEPWLGLATGLVDWADASARPEVSVSGQHSDLVDKLPLL